MATFEFTPPHPSTWLSIIYPSGARMCHTIIQQKIDGSAKLQAQAQPMEFVQPQYVPKNYASCASYCSIFTIDHDGTLN